MGLQQDPGLVPLLRFDDKGVAGHGDAPFFLIPREKFRRATAGMRYELLRHVPFWVLASTALQVLLFATVANPFAGAALRLPVGPETQYWTFVTALFVHADAVHLWNNVGMQLSVGGLYEVSNGWRRTALVFLAGGVCGTLAEAAFFVAGSDVVLFYLGASPAALAYVGAAISHVLLNWAEMPWLWRRLWLACCALILVQTVVLHVLDVRFSLTMLVAHTSHEAGWMQGLALGLALSHNAVLRRYERWFRLVGGLGSAAGFLVPLAVLLV